MIRWWDDPDAARIVLAAVDDSDVVQGVGTASLGLHALAKAALTPLLGATLVDRVDVAAVLEHLPLEPVSKALAEATRPLLSEAADRYGVLLATELSHQARDGASAMVQALTARGLPMPLAVARAAEVAGLPPNRIGPYVEAMKDPATSALVVADAADRALMTYAAALGRAEATGEEAVAKEMRFRERDHPRDVEGRFATKGGEIDPRLARRKKRLRLAGLAGAIPTQTEAREGSLTDLVRALRPKAAPAEAPRTRTQPDLGALAASVRAAPAEEPKAKTRTRTVPKAKGKEHRRVITAEEVAAKLTAGYQGYDLRPVAGRNGMILPVGILDRINDGAISVAGIEGLQGGAQAVVFSERQLENLLAEAERLGSLNWSEVGYLEFVEPQLPITETVNPEGYGIGHALAPQAVIGPVNRKEWADKRNRLTIDLSDDRPINMGDTESVEYVPRERVLPVLRVEIKNLAHIEATNPRNAAKAPPVKAVEGEVSMALHRTVERWSGDRQSHLVTRDEGRFATAGGSPDQLRAAATARRRKRAALAGAAALRPVAIPNEASLLELVQALRPPATVAREAPAERPAITATSLAQLAATARQAEAKPKGRIRTAATSRKGAKPTAAPKAASTTDEAFRQNEAIRIPWDQMSATADMGDLHWMDEGKPIRARLVPEEEREGLGLHVDLRSGPVLQALHSYLTDERRSTTHATGLGSKEATSLAIDIEAGAFESTRRGADPHEGRIPSYVRPELNEKTGLWDVVETKYGRPEVMVYGSPEAIALYQSSDPNVELDFEMTGSDIHALAVHENTTLNEGGRTPPPLFAVKVTIPKDNRPTATRPPGGA